jgi:hypothetical protein
MSMQRKLLPLSCSLLLGAMVAGQANAQGLPPPFIEYAAKFTCGRVPPPNPAGGGDADVVVGVYATSINIHNPQAATEVPFLKKIVVANPEGQPRGQIVESRDVLPPDQAERVDCPLIFRLLKITPGTHIEGFVVLELAINPNQPQSSLDVVGKYSARPSTGEVSSLDVVIYSPKEITR